MPVVRVSRFVPSFDVGAQYIENVLTLPTSPDTTTIVLSSTIYTSPGTYVLFDYSASGAGTPVVGQISQIVISAPPGRSVDTGVAPNGVANNGKQITVTLV